MKKIGLFGGTFDPIHRGHIHIARAFADELNLDIVIFLPAGDPYHKTEATRTPARDRLAMVERAIAGDERFAVSDCDMVREGATYTFDTVEIFRQQFPAAELWCLLGMDSLMNLHTWYRWQDLVNNIRIAVAAREGDNIAHAPPQLHEWIGTALQNGRLRLLKAPQFNLSSTKIRHTIQQGGDTSAWLNPQVADYIRRHRLYR